MNLGTSGHRPQKLGPGPENLKRLALGGLVMPTLLSLRPDKVFVGMALGFDQAVAASCVYLDIPFVAMVPFEGQESKWSKSDQFRYNTLLGAASEVRISGRIDSDNWVEKLFRKRNQDIVDASDRMLVLYSGAYSGTGHCVEAARKAKLEVVNLWDSWTTDRSILDTFSLETA